MIVGCLELLVAASRDERAGRAAVGRGRRRRGGARAGDRRAADLGVLAGGRSSSCRSRSCCWRCPPRSRCAAGSCERQDGPVADRPHVLANLALALALGGAHGGAVPAGAAARRGLAPLARRWRPSRSRRCRSRRWRPGRSFRALRAGTRSEAVAGSVLIAGGLAGLALLPGAKLVWTIAPQVLVGLGLGLTRSTR